MSARFDAGAVVCPILRDVMSSEKTSTESAWLLDAERDVQKRLGDEAFDFRSLDAIANIYRAAAAIRRRAEGDVLAPYGPVSYTHLTLPTTPYV